jgi:hypothetical protein
MMGGQRMAPQGVNLRGRGAHLTRRYPHEESYHTAIGTAMSRLRNRMTKGDFWTDASMKRWPPAKRFFYMSLWAMAEDSCCVEDDPMGWKIACWSGPMDDEFSVEQMTEWRKEMVRQRKLVPYKRLGTRCCYIPTMGEHERMRNPQPPTLPLPHWVEWIPEKNAAQRGHYVHVFTECSLSKHRDARTTQSCPVLSSPDLSGTDRTGQDIEVTSPVDEGDQSRRAEGGTTGPPPEVRAFAEKMKRKSAGGTTP